MDSFVYAPTTYRRSPDLLTLGQYLQPFAHHLPVLRYVTPNEFKMFETEAYKMSFVHAAWARWCDQAIMPIRWRVRLGLINKTLWQFQCANVNQKKCRAQRKKYRDYLLAYLLINHINMLIFMNLCQKYLLIIRAKKMPCPSAIISIQTDFDVYI
jgi:hypothetical protein